MAEPLRFKVAPHIVEDLGLNLYTSLPRVLVEFVANAYDADADFANVEYDPSKIEAARAIIRKAYERELQAQQIAIPKEGTLKPPIQSLGTRVLPDELTISVEDNGEGMSREDLDKKFLVAGRRRRIDEDRTHTKKGRLLMGRKGLGKLAGFGVAKLVTVITRKRGERHATKIELDYDALIKNKTTHEIEIGETKLSDGGGFKESGTRIVLSRLMYDPLKSRATTIENEIAEHFSDINQKDFEIRLNAVAVSPVHHNFAYAWPEPDTVPIDKLVPHTLQREEGGTVSFEYRIRFTGKNEALPASRRGIRVYARHRLAAAPSLLGADTNMHGFRMTDYVDGVVSADFIDEEQADYIATDRQSLRWESPLLSEMHEFLSREIKEACKNYQKKRDAEAELTVRKDQFTEKTVGLQDFSKKDQSLAYNIASLLEGACKQGVDDPIYKAKLPIIVSGIGHGNILAAISELAEEDHPDLGAVSIQIARLTKDELGRFITTANTRLKAIKALKKVVENVDFNESKEEKTVQKMFEASPWLLDPTYSQFLTANKSSNSLILRLAKELEVADYAPLNSEQSDNRPDLVFLIGNQALSKLIIIELKAPNVSLEAKHLTQLETYMATATEWLQGINQNHVQVFGQLVGSLNPASRANGAIALRSRIKKAGSSTDWVVRDFLEVLKHTEEAHTELIEIHRNAEQKVLALTQ